MAAFQIVIGFGRVQDLAAAGIDHHQLARAHAAFLYHFIRLVIPDADFRGTGNQLIFGDDVACRTQTVTVQVTGGVAAVGHHDTGRAVPRLHVHRVEVEEGAQIGIHIRVVLPGWRNQQAHGADQVHTACQQQLQHVIQRAGVGTGFVNERRCRLQIRDQRRLEFISTCARPLAVAGDGVDFAVVRQVAERLRQRPAWHGVGGKTLMEQADGRFQTQVRQIKIETGQIRRHAQAFIDRHQIREAAYIKAVVLDALLDTAARDKQAAFHIAWAPTGRGVNENLFNTRQGGEGNFTQNVRVGRHFTPANNRQRFVLQLFFYNAAAGTGFLFVLAEEHHANGVVLG